MDLKNHAKEAFGNILVAKMRSILTLLGVLIGTGSVVALVSSGQLATEHALAQFKTLGTDLLSVSINQSGNQSDSASPQQQQQLSLSDATDKLGKVSTDIEYVAPYTNYFSPISYAGTSIDGTVLGVTQELQEVIKIQMYSGRFISYLDHNAFYAVIGNAVAQKIIQTGTPNPIGKQIRVGQNIYTIVGVMDPWPENIFMYADLDNALLVPIENSFLLSKYVQIQNIIFKLKPQSDIGQIQKQLTQVMANLAPNLQLFYRSPKELIASMEKQRQTLTLLLSLIGGISLLVGGIGVMNIMLVSVVERRREIGIRMAIGATRRDIQIMFLAEAIALTVTGGFLGIVIGVIVSYVAAKLSGWDFQFFVLPPIIGFLVSVLVGIFFGFYPAYKASRLDPIETLRSD